MDEHREERHEDQVRVDGRRCEPEDVERYEREPAGDDDVDQVQARAGQPVERLRRVVDGVEPPEPRHPVEGAVDPVLGEVGDEHDLDDLEHQRLRRDRVLEPRPGGPPEEQRGRQHREHDRQLHHQVTHREVHQVGRPARPEDPLLGAARRDALERHEEQREDEQVQQEPVEPRRGRAVDRSLDLDAGASEQRAGGREGEAREAEDLAAPENDAQRAEAEADHQHRVDQEADQLHRIVCAGRGRREPVREQETEHAAVSERAARGRQDTADPARAELTARAPTERHGHANANARAGFSTSSRVSPASSTPLARSRGTTFTRRWW